MSRRCEAKVRGAVEVLLVCDQCGKESWVPTALTTCAQDPEWEAVEQHGWFHVDDAIVCSEKCDAAFWEDQAKW